MLKLKENSKKSPPGGHHYVEHRVTFKGESWTEVVKKVTDFRLHNNIPQGNPSQEVLNFYADNWPWLVKEDESAPEPEPAPSQYDLWRDWIYRTWKNPPKKLVTPTEAKARWAICSTCPMNEQFKFSESSESAELTRRTFLLRRGIESSEALAFCSCHKADLASFSFFDNAKEYSRMHHPIEKPDRCWVDL